VSALAEPTFAWEPVTPRGVAAFARASLERLVVVQAIFALLAAAAFTWLLSDGLFPAVDAAVAQLPATGEIRNGRLVLPDTSPAILAEGRLLEINVDLKHSGQIRSPAEFQVEFGENSLSVFSLFGEAEIAYPAGQSFPFNRTDVQPLWGAWSPDLLALAAIGTFLCLMLTWALLATLYFLPVWLICFFANRDLNFRQSWQLAGAALMPGALLMSLSLFLYDWGDCDLVQLCFAFGLHLVIGWIYLFVSPLFLNRALPSSTKNPFTDK
jgi:hypothetical protein